MAHDDLIHEAFRRRAAERPGATALAHPEGTVGYGELDRWSDGLAAVLAAEGVGPGAIVPVLLPPSPSLAAVLLAVLKCGAAYAAIDTGWPAERLRRVAELLPGQIAVTGPGAGAGFAGRRVVIGPDGSATPGATPDATPDTTHRPPPIVAGDGAAAMVFFTSGSTGEPKAVLSPHRATMRLFTGPTFARFGHGTVMAQIAAVPWDALAMELWGPLVSGGTCALVTERPLTPAGLREAVTRYGVTTVFLTTSLFHLIVEEDLTAFAGLRTLVVGGEKLSAAHAGRLLAAWPELRLVNGYGPVESAVFALTHDVRPADVGAEIPLGRPVPRTRVVLMGRGERAGEQCAPGETGELCVAGDGLAIGYLGDPGLTAAKFTTERIDGQPLRLYRTGDLGRRGPDGVVHFHGRLDRQVKVRGHRLEPAGIERLADEVPGVRRSVVAVRRDGNGNATALALFYLPTDGHPAPAALTSALRNSLPGYSVPDEVIAVERIPLSATGKADTAALLAAFPGPRRDREPGEPQDRADPGALAGRSVGDVVADEVGALLGAGEVDRDASVFALGASSLTAVRLCTRLGTRFGRGIPVSQLMRTPTVAGLAEWLETFVVAPGAAVEPAVDEPSGGAPLTAAQHSFVLQHLRSGADLANNCPLSWTVTGPLDPDRLAAAVEDTHRRHGYLRARYEADDEVLAFDSQAPARFTRLVSDEPATAERLLEEHLAQPFDLAAGLVWRAVLVGDQGADRWLFGVAVHHVAFDGWSQHLLAREIGLAYAARGTGALPASVQAAPPQTVPTPAQTYRLLQELTGAVDLAAQRAYWARNLAGIVPITWPASGDPADPGPRSVEYPLDDGLLARIAEAARRQGAGLLTVLLEAVSRAVSAHTGQDDFGVGVPVSRRSTEALQRPVGCLIDTVCVRLRRTADPDSGTKGTAGATGSRTDGTAHAVAGALANADLSFAEVVRVVRPARSRRHPLYQVIAAVQDSPAPVLEVAGCGTRIREQDDVAWPQAELLVQLFNTPGERARLRVSRDLSAVGFAAFSAMARDIFDILHGVARQESGRGER